MKTKKRQQSKKNKTIKHIQSKYNPFVKTLKPAYPLYASKKYDGNSILEYTKKQEKIHYFKERVELIFKGSMAILLILLFNPRTTKDMIKLDYETKLLLFLFGWVLIITADWKSIFANIPKSINMFQDIFGDNHES
jgi:hypothetical protein